jgi:dienelactone hydrolase
MKPLAAIIAPVIVVTVVTITLFTSRTFAEIKMQPIDYKVGDANLQGFLAYDDSVPANQKRPGVIVVHEWWGLNDYPKMRAQMLAKLGYVAFCADMFGKGKTTEDPKQAQAWATEVYKNPDVAKARSQAAFEMLKKQPQVDPSMIAAIGYCFGGSIVLDMARSGMDLTGVVTFHGGLDTEHRAQKGQVKAQILVCHGADDGFETPESVAALQKEMTDAGVVWQMNIYSGAQHAFTNPNVDKYGLQGARYNKIADQRSWEAMQAFFREIFGPATK